MPTAYDSRSTIATDPLRNFKYIVTLNIPSGGGWDGKDAAARFGFMSVSGLSLANEPIPYREGGDNTTPRKLAGQSNFSDVTLTRGVVLGSFRNWYAVRRVFHAIQGLGRAYPGANYRFTTDIHVLDHPVNNASMHVPSKMSFRLYNAWPTALAYSDLDAGGNAVLVEQMTLTHEGFDIVWATSAGNAGPVAKLKN